MAEDGVIDLAARQRSKLEGELARLRASNEALIALAKANLAAQAQTHAAVLAVMEAETLLALDRKLAGRVAGALTVDVVRVFLEGHAPLPAGQAIQPCAPEFTEALLGSKAERLGPIDTRYADALYAGKASSLRTEAIARLDVGGVAGALCLGSRDGDMFRPDQAADLLHFLARVLERRLAPWLKD
jgi:uncharacterized protein YigA (DUF484 family)